MRHRVKGKKLGRDTKHRKALFRNLMRQLVLHGSIQTTETKGKEVKRMADKLVSKAKVDTVDSRRNLHKYFGKRDVVNSLVEQVAPTFKDRSSGFTRVVRVGKRSGDNAQLVKVGWVVEPDVKGSLKNPKPKARPTSKSKSTAKKSTASKKTTKTKKTAKKTTK